MSSAAWKWVDKHPWMTYFLAGSAIVTVGSLASSLVRGAFGDVKPGDTGPDVTDWQQNLSDLGFPVTVTGVYDDATWSATVNFKQSQGLPANGVVDAATLDAMGAQFDKMHQGHTPVGLPREGQIDITGRLSPQINWALLTGAALLVGAATLTLTKDSPRSRRRR